MLKIKLSNFVCISLLTTTCMVQAVTLDETINSVNVNNTELQSIKHSNEASKNKINKSKATYRPKLDFELTGEAKKTRSQLNSNPESVVDQKGYNAKLKLEQIIWDGGLTSSSISESKYAHRVNVLSNKIKSDDIILEGINAYLEVIRYTKRLELANENVTKNQEHLKVAQENEKLTDEALETYQAKAKLHLAKKIRFDEEEGFKKAENTYTRVANEKIVNVCLPDIDASLVPNRLDDLIELTLTNNNEIKAQKQSILRQDAVVGQTSSTSKPTIKFYLSASHDDDLLAKDTVQDNVSAKIVLNYNLYNGGADSALSETEKIFLIEEKVKLETTVNKVVEEVSSEYVVYNNSLKRIDELKAYVNANTNILEIYKSQFEGGTKTFSDILDAWTDVYNSKKLLSDEYINMNESYFKIMKISSQFDIIESKALACKTDLLYVNNKSTVKASKTTTTSSKNIQSSSATKSDLENVFKAELDNGILVYDEKRDSIRFAGKISSLPATKYDIELNSEYKEHLDAFIPKLIKYVKKDETKMVSVDGYSSSDFKDIDNEEKKFLANLEISRSSALKVYDYIKHKFPNDAELFKTVFFSHKDVITDDNGKEIHNLSKRVEFRVVNK